MFFALALSNTKYIYQDKEEMRIVISKLIIVYIKNKITYSINYLILVKLKLLIILLARFIYLLVTCLFRY